MPRVAIVGAGYVGNAYLKMFPDAVVYDEPKEICRSTDKAAFANIPDDQVFLNQTDQCYYVAFSSVVKQKVPVHARAAVNACDIAIVAVPTDLTKDGTLDMSVIEEVVGWLDTPLILIKSALMPGTVDRLVQKTGKKIAISVEYIGMGNYYLDPHDYPDPLDPRKHKVLVIGGESGVAQACANVLWAKMSPATRVHIVSAKEAELCKLLENFYGALKVTFANCFYSLVEKSGQNFIRTHQSWSEDGRTDPMHTRVVPGKRGWKSHCYDKDVIALQAVAKQVGATDMHDLVQQVLRLNQEHLKLNG